MGVTSTRARPQAVGRRLRGFDDPAKVITGVKFNDGIEVTDLDQDAA
jgi:hypothetical protein